MELWTENLPTIISIYWSEPTTQPNIGSWDPIVDAKQYVVYRTPAGSVFDFDNAANVYDIITASNDDTTVNFDDEITGDAFDYYVSVVDKASNESTVLSASTNDLEDGPLICGVGYELVEGECEEVKKDEKKKDEKSDDKK